MGLLLRRVATAEWDAAGLSWWRERVGRQGAKLRRSLLPLYSVRLRFYDAPNQLGRMWPALHCH